MPKLRNPRWEAVAQNTAAGMKRPDAYLAAGYQAKNRKVAGNRCSDLINKHPEVLARISELEEEIRENAARRAQVDREYVLDGLKENAERAMQQEEVLDRDGNPTGEYRWAGATANRAYELIGKELGMFADRLILDDLDSELEKMSGDDLKNYVRAMAGEVGLRVVDMNEEQIRAYIYQQAPRVGLRVAEGREGLDGLAAAQSEDVQPVPEADGVPRGRTH